MGKFTQSVKRIVQEVKEDGTQGNQISPNAFYCHVSLPVSFCLVAVLVHVRLRYVTF